MDNKEFIQKLNRIESKLHSIKSEVQSILSEMSKTEARENTMYCIDCSGFGITGKDEAPCSSCKGTGIDLEMLK